MACLLKAEQQEIPQIFGGPASGGQQKQECELRAQTAKVSVYGHRLKSGAVRSREPEKERHEEEQVCFWPLFLSGNASCCWLDLACLLHMGEGGLSQTPPCSPDKRIQQAMTSAMGFFFRCSHTQTRFLFLNLSWRRACAN